VRVGLVQAVNDPQLLGGGFQPWPRQQEILEAIERGPRMQALAFGRRSGKTTLAALVMLWDCLLRPELSGMVRPGERRHAVAIGTNLRQARLLVRAALSIVERSPLLAELVEGATEDEITFANGAALSAFPCSSRGGRGWPISTFVLDEAAHFISDTEGPAVADRVFNALVPATAQFGDRARVLLCSTPWGTEGLFADIFQRASTGELVDAVAHRASSAEMNPTLSSAFLDAEQARDPEMFRSEYLAEFVGSGGAFLDPERVADAVADRRELLPEQARGWVAGIDPAFASDPFGLALVGLDHYDRGRLVVGRAQAWKPSRGDAASFEQRRAREDHVLGEVAELCRRFRAQVVTDQYAAPSVVARLQQAGLSVRTVPMTATSKTDVFLELRARLNSGSLELYNEHQLLAELRRLRVKYTAGSSAVINPRVGGSHGDLAQALALAVWANRNIQGEGPVLARTGVINDAELDRVFAVSMSRRSSRLYDGDAEAGLLGKVF